MSEQKKQTGIWLAAIVAVIILVAVIGWTLVKQNPSEQSHQAGLDGIIKAARNWGPAYKSWHGKMAPDFALTDITGKQHKLSDYRGKDVVLTFWATWCPACNMEIPHLIQLRNDIGEDKLAILAISNEQQPVLERFVADRGINYTVLINQLVLSMPYSAVSSIPSSFFIDAEGKIKLGAIGVLSLEEIKAVLKAQ
ncbi:MAG: peroxiredoxin family protein [Planctomycetota bacterium]|jgi:peroxiredoxin